MSTISMDKAVKTVINKSMGCKNAAMQFNVSQTTLERYVKKRIKASDSVLQKKIGRFSCIFNGDQEAELVQYLTKMEAQLFGLTIDDLRDLAFQLAKRNKIPHSFKDGKAELEWARPFISRHPELSLRKCYVLRTPPN